MKFFKYIFSIIILSAVLLSCGHNHKEGDGHDHDHDHSDHAEADAHAEGDHSDHEEGALHLSQAQAKTIGLQFGNFSSIKVNDFVKATGVLGLPSNAQTSVSARSTGTIRGTKKYVEGGYIKKGEIIASLENPDFIGAQQSYLEIMAELALERLEVDRQKTLASANAGVTRDLQQAEAKVKILSTKAKGISKQLEYLGISTTELTPDNIRDQIAIVSPASGYISEVNIHDGMYVERSSILMEIISARHLHLELDVFENDIAKVKQGLKISYSAPALGDKIFDASVNVVGKEFNAQSKTVRVHGHLDGDKPQFIRDLFVNAKIWLNDNTVNALPEKAIITDGATAFIYVATNDDQTEEIEFEKLSVIPGATSDGFTAVKLIDPIPAGKEIITEGAYYVYAQSKVGELAHEH